MLFKVNAGLYFYASAPVIAVTGDIMFSSCLSHSCECHIKERLFGYNSRIHTLIMTVFFIDLDPEVLVWVHPLHFLSLDDTGITYVSILPNNTYNTFLLNSFSPHYIYYMSLDRHECKLQFDWLAEAYNRGAVILVYTCGQTKLKTGRPAAEIILAQNSSTAGSGNSTNTSLILFIASAAWPWLVTLVLWHSYTEFRTC